MYFCTKNSSKLKSNSIFILLFPLLASCHGPEKENVVAPWGEEIGSTETTTTDAFDLDQIQQAGELIMLTISGPETYYDYHGKVLGLHAMLCKELADSLGVRLRIELCRDTADLVRRMKQGDADLAAYPLTTPDSVSPGWYIPTEKPLLKETITRWYSMARMAQMRNEEQQALNSPTVQRKVYAPMLNRQGGIISRYDGLFQQYCQPLHWDWRLMAAQCYQESTFDPDALSWAGARGLMQIMPATAGHLGLELSQINNPAQNIAAAARYIAELEKSFSDIHDRRERQDFVLAAYNGGAHHIRDAMALARLDGRNAHRWSDVSEYVLKLSQPQFYNNPVVKSGYMRGRETVDYVRLIRQRYQQYRGVRAAMPASSTPQPSRNARHRKKYDLKSEE